MGKHDNINFGHGNLNDPSVLWTYLGIAAGNVHFYDKAVSFARANDYVTIYEIMETIFVRFQYTDDFFDWYSNLRLKKIEVKSFAGEIHTGFYQAWIRFRNLIDDYFLNIDRDKSIISCCYSRGGALGTLCIRHLRKNLKFKRVCNITYGAPRIGDEHFVKEYRELDIPTIIIRNGWDPVPVSPPKSWGYRDIYSVYRIKRPFSRWFLNPIEDHSIGEYYRGLVMETKKKKNIW